MHVNKTYSAVGRMQAQCTPSRTEGLPALGTAHLPVSGAGDLGLEPHKASQNDGLMKT